MLGASALDDSQCAASFECDVLRSLKAQDKCEKEFSLFLFSLLVYFCKHMLVQLGLGPNKTAAKYGSKRNNCLSFSLK